jgi:hypothetical protein
MSRRRPAAALVAVFILAALPAAAAPALAADGAAAARARAVAYWTPARMRAAVPREFVRATTGNFKPLARPAPGGGGTVVGASWPNGSGLVYKAVGKVFFTMGGSNWVCSGAVASDATGNDSSLILTAAHCAYDEVADVFATNWIFIPQYDSNPTSTCSQTAFGCWTTAGGGALTVHDGYASREAFDDEATWHDFAIARVGQGGKGGGVPSELDIAVGSFPIQFQDYLSDTQMSAFGYPAAGKYKGRDLTYCAGPVFFDPYNSERTYGMDCNMTGGSSGGPWLSSFNNTTGSGILSSLNSYGYSGIRAMHGPKFGPATEQVYAGAATGGNEVVD